MDSDAQDTRYRERWSRTPAPDAATEGPRRPSLAARIGLLCFALLPWALYFGLVFTSWWLIGFDGRASTDALGWTLLALALPALFVAAQVSRVQRGWIRARFNFEMWTRRPSGGGGGFGDWLNLP